jgi:4-hydroxybutyryl-CoA dehydratase/vinylacetyl-CoA-Delta-isomerase
VQRNSRLASERRFPPGEDYVESLRRRNVTVYLFGEHIAEPVDRFLHIVGSPDVLVMKNRMQRRLGQLTGACFQRCAGLDTIFAVKCLKVPGSGGIFPEHFAFLFTGWRHKSPDGQ